MTTTNASLLTRSQTVYAAKKRAKKAQIPEIIFDDEARRDYLTGFRKRNLEKKESKRKRAIERERLERLEIRKQQRQELAERAAKNAKEVESALGMQSGEPEDEKAAAGESHNEALEFSDEEHLAVVTVVEDFSPDSLLHGEARQAAALSDTSQHASDAAIPHQSGSRSQDKATARIKQRIKAKPKKVHYETQAARKAERTKQRARKAEKAERAVVKKKTRSRR
ncbi:nucleolar protein 12-domain-containing protein [Hysterangium stoloniferum]|nr:nucleolar protein 12-domain-containing protein [Hysterangium stoloniferum]